MSERLQFTIPYTEDVETYISENYPEVIDYRIRSESLDARKANIGRVPTVNYTVEVIYEGEEFPKAHEDFKQVGPLKSAPIIIGAGPAGLFAALRFAEYGVPTLIFERGTRAHERMKHISKYWRKGELDPDNNVCFGEGGAGLFSDGKLITRVKSPYVQYVMDKFVEFGAPAETAWISNPHLGSNKIRQLIGKITGYLADKGHQFHYNSRVEKILVKEGKAIGIELSDGKQYFSDHIILAAGHSAREMYHHLKEINVDMTPKDFAVGVRVEHPREVIDTLQYGDYAGAGLGASRYRLSWENPQTHKGTYSFCMCPGGYVLSSGTDDFGIVVNGMSNYARNSRWSNSALVVSVKAGVDFSTDDVLGGLYFQNAIEKNALNFSRARATGKEVPVQNLKDFLSNSLSGKLPKTSCPSGIFEQDLREVLPSFVSQHLTNALEMFNSRMKGFVTDKALLLAPETRTSAPVTITRNKETLVSTNISGLYPCGEGAGYAGGITSAAVDGIKVAMSILQGSL